MLTRRLGLLASALAVGAGPAFAQQRHPHVAPGGHKGKDAAGPTGSPADTPLGPVDTAARWAFIQDFDTGATPAGEACGRRDAAVVDDQADDDVPRL